MRNYLDTYCSKEILHKVETINNLKKESLDKIFGVYKLLDISEYNVKAPKIILEKLKKANLESDKEKLVEIISQKFCERIAEIKKEGPTRKTELNLG